MKKLLVVFALSLATLPAKIIGVNILLKSPPAPQMLNDLGKYCKVRSLMLEINAVTAQADDSQLPLIRALPFVAAANPDAERKAGPVNPLSVDNFAGGLSTWNLDAMDVTDYGFNNRTVPYDGSGVYVAVLDTGLVDNWTSYFPTERIAVQYAASFGGGGGEMGTVSTQPNKWGHDQNSHGTHVTSSILGYSLRGIPVNGVAPKATVIPVKVLGQSGRGWSSVIAHGVVYIANLKQGPLAGSPVIINMSLGGPELDAVEEAAIDYAISKGVIVVASAGNEGDAGMGYPGAYAPVISVAASGWTGEWIGGGSWWYGNVADPTSAPDFYIAGFSSRAKAGQDLDVAAPGSWVVGPYQTNGQISYYFLGGTSMASPHVAGLVALMAQKKAALTAAEAESILQSSAIPLAPGCRNIAEPSGAHSTVCWGADAPGAGLANAPAALGLVVP